MIVPGVGDAEKEGVAVGLTVNVGLIVKVGLGGP
jgi:hypothetical protein